MRVKQVEVSALCHATEDPEKIKAALSFLTGSEQIYEEDLEGKISVASGDNTVKLVVVAGGRAEKGGSKEFFAGLLGDGS